VHRLREVTPEFSPEDSNVAVVAEICRQLDGIPLALELAAARAQLLPPAALLSSRRVSRSRAASTHRSTSPMR
jgi:predicted ATPase